MAHHKRKRSKNQRAGCLMCKPWKMNGFGQGWQEIRRLRDLSKNEKVECLLAVCDLVDGFGQPHVHSGLGIRKLGDKLFECRGNRDLRFLFQDRGIELCVLPRQP